MKQQDFQTTWMKACLILNPGHGIKKINSKSTMWMKNDFTTKTWQEQNKITKKINTQNLCSTHWRWCRILTLFIPIRHIVQGSFLKIFQLPCGPCSPMCTHMWPMFIHVGTNNELWIKEKWIKSELKFNYIN
jgi:hypothetical protein